MTKNIAYQTSKVVAEESLRWAGKNPEYSVPLGLALADPRTRNFALRTFGSFAKETGRYKWRMLKETGRNLLKGGKPIGYTKKSGTGYVGRAVSKLKLTSPYTIPLVVGVGYGMTSAYHGGSIPGVTQFGGVGPGYYSNTSNPMADLKSGIEGAVVQAFTWTIL